ncbi:ABC transporter ATP-binding protein [Magnetospira sp. QH-2]|uniref:ABC transporter ATP-binding protein n=1 Tax=Magnetospira sp. (strain QH-2) TaxID=1288970 RepID=UPI0003E80D7A|nr:oligopeptide/dipeptide ABC transporter ATP-binding protein [Magnetospira sp. QH-2]CCQ73667.1 Putative dipeptide transporter; ATP-binding component of ABC superfamily [Magnetospira sp. QH-2]
MNDHPLLAISGLSKTFTKPLGMTDRIANLLGAERLPETVRAVDDVTFDLRPGEALGLVGESGCGKSTIARMVMKLLTPSSGAIAYRGNSLETIPEKQLLKIQMVFQDPYSSLNPRMRISQQIEEAIGVHGIVPASERQSYLEGIFDQCGIQPGLTKRYPHQFSGGQRQRFGIARALAMQPDLMVCDEPVAALDVSIQAQIINLFATLREHQKIAYLFISHDLSVIRHLCDRVAVMYLGRIVEEGPVDKVLDNPGHPYTQALKESSPAISAGKRAFEPIRGEIPSPLAPPPGCHFHPRCPKSVAACSLESPRPLRGPDDRRVACHLAH